MNNIERKPQVRFKGFTDPWEQRKLGDMGTTFTGLSGKTKEDFGHGEAKFVTYMNVFTNPVSDPDRTEAVEIDKSQNSVQYGDVFFTTSSETPEEVGMSSVWLKNTENTYLNSFCFGYRPSTEIDPYYMAYMLRSDIVREKIIYLAQGISRYNISKNGVMQIEVPLPELREQKLLGKYFSDLDNLITLHQRKYDKLLKVKKSMLEKMFPRNGSNVPEIRFAGFTDPWEQRKVFEVADRFDNLRIPVAANLRIPGSTPYYGANGIQDYVEGFTHDGEFVLVAEDGANDLKNYPVRCVNGRIWVNNHAHVLQSKPEMADNKFLAYSISQTDIEALLVGGGRAKLNAEVMMNMDLCLPSVKEQVAIGSYLSKLDSLITLHQRKLEKLQNIKKSMLEKMFV